MMNFLLKYISVLLQAIAVGIGSLGFLVCMYFFLSDSVGWDVLTIGVVGVVFGFFMYKFSIKQIHDDRYY
ncbi:TPA: hypothetical protein ACXIJH_005239 [Serratia marcescens]